ncbi:MAG: GreA/GreB family elongation factor [Candidatus Methylacidiphilales bacterium]|nr:GreA/GreB family elongation factor [Candidatus Methylacidiphilales bacterium]
MDTDLQTISLPETVSPAVASKLRKLQPGTYCLHKSWGFGLVKEWVPESNQLLLDFKGKHGHAMQFQYAADSLQPLPKDHIFVRKAVELDKVRDEAMNNPVPLVRGFIHSLGSTATADTLQAVLCPDVVPTAGWKKWWDTTKRTLKKDGHFNLPSRKTEPLQLLEAPNELGDQAVEAFRAAIGPKAQLTAIINLQKSWLDIKNDALADEIVASLDATLSKVPRSQLSLAVELALSRDDFLVLAGRPITTGPLSIVEMSPRVSTQISNILDDLPSNRQPRFLESLKVGLPDEWQTLFLSLLPRANGRTADYVTQSFVDAGKEAEIVGAVNRLLRERSITCDFLHWFCKNRLKIFSSLLEPQLFLAILSVLEKDQLSDIKRGTKLYELVLSDRDLVAAILKDSPFEDVRDTVRAIMLSPVFEELDKRSLLGVIIKLFPEVQPMVSGPEKITEDASGYIVSWESLDKRKTELEDIVTKRIPENSRDIGIAREYGDLRENSEFKSAKEAQTVLMRRKAELEAMIVQAKGTDFFDADPSRVNIGTIVHLVDLNESSKKLSYTILGAWDSDPELGIISYLTAVAKTLMGKKVGDVIDLPSDTGIIRRVKITSIEKFIKEKPVRK